ncbi:Uncharacterised protein [Chlamydia trachomatis]|nr:Uncharacterised protein [Chlamydia trachomatis]
MSNIINNIALIESFGDFKDEKGISKIDLMAIIEDSLKTERMLIGEPVQ